ncbi:MAG TPA: hypothetical protein VFC19_29390 [Candidatus Limnocylindrales bacterium]|nr:hypothetical protein [Candidatus Limnocylindrales bacterium]
MRRCGYKRPNPPGKTAAAVIAAGVITSTAMTIYLLYRHPTGHDPVHSPTTDGRNTDLLIAGAILLTGFLCLTLTPPPAPARNPRAATIGTIMGLIFSAGYIPANMYLAETIVLYCLGAPLILFTVAAVLGGAPAAVWAGLTAALWSFSIPLLAHFQGYQVEAIKLDDTEPGVIPDPQLYFPSLLGQDLGTAFFGMVWFPAWALLLGIVGHYIAKATQAFRRKYGHA